MNSLFIDVETTGLVKTLSRDIYPHPSDLVKYDGARIIELAYKIRKTDDSILTRSFLITIVGFKIENTHIHGITEDMCNVNGISINDVLDILENDIDENTHLLSYNLLFDLNIILSECYRCDKQLLINKLNSCKQTCIMKFASSYLDIAFNIKLIMLHQYLFHLQIKQNHRALDDVNLAMECYYKMCNNEPSEIITKITQISTIIRHTGKNT